MTDRFDRAAAKRLNDELLERLPFMVAQVARETDDWDHDPWGSSIMLAFDLNDLATMMWLTTDPSYKAGLLGPACEGHNYEWLRELWDEGSLDSVMVERSIELFSEHLDALRELGCDY